MTDESLSHLGERVLRRRTIEVGLSEGKNISDVRADVKEKSQRQRELFRDLSEKIINPDPQYLKLTEYFYEKLSVEFPEIVACGLTGSGALGGAQLRREIGEMDDTDYDGFLVLKEGTVYMTVHRAQIRASELLEELLNKKDKLVDGLPENFQFCNSINYREFYLQDLEGMTSEEVLQILDEKQPKVTLQYFFPTYPPQVGEENTRRIFEALNSVPVPRWQYHANRLKDAWEENIMTLKDKHILPRATNRWSYRFAVGERAIAPHNRLVTSLQRDVKLGKEVLKEAVKTSRNLFNEMIDSTRPSEVE